MTDLKLIALDTEDLEVVSAHLQDAVVRVGDMGFARKDRRFAMLLNRFDWESDQPRKKGLRKRAALHFDAVRSASSAGFDVNARDGVLELLAIHFSPTDLPSGVIELSFAGGATVRLHVDYLEARMADLGAAWSASGRPQHALD
ncbi:hypothetical protein GCM10007989_29000 [Devosia pacifica]|uniref:DUF2948 family protein n=1 Tax=Devosia pacifica TaxID=1335967 RepID=A0A918SBS7_9HYPH|nr:DUF2948 family protein [Devosia pacifica]GHA31244.1 hypothetical protein GCM10007989_29000 [Devosia pacifica]